MGHRREPESPRVDNLRQRGTTACLVMILLVGLACPASPTGLPQVVTIDGASLNLQKLQDEHAVLFVNLSAVWPPKLEKILQRLADLQERYWANRIEMVFFMDSTRLLPKYRELLLASHPGRCVEDPGGVIGGEIFAGADWMFLLRAERGRDIWWARSGDGFMNQAHVPSTITVFSSAVGIQGDPPSSADSSRPAPGAEYATAYGGSPPAGATPLTDAVANVLVGWRAAASSPVSDEHFSIAAKGEYETQASFDARYEEAQSRFDESIKGKESTFTLNLPLTDVVYDPEKQILTWSADVSLGRGINAVSDESVRDVWSGEPLGYACSVLRLDNRSWRPHANNMAPVACGEFRFAGSDLQASQCCPPSDGRAWKEAAYSRTDQATVECTIRVSAKQDGADAECRRLLAQARLHPTARELTWLYSGLRITVESVRLIVHGESVATLQEAAAPTVR